MTVKEKTGRKRYVHFSDPKVDKLRKMVRSLEGSRVVNYYGIVAIRVRHSQVPYLRELASELDIKIDMISGTLRSLRKKLSEIK
ncbi:MAG: hypothetical protein QXU18_07810 [Thermoplasmatales archaeon]